jgi:hypothetical protein
MAWSSGSLAGALFCRPRLRAAGCRHPAVGHGQGHVAVPPGVAADLVVVQVAFLLGALEALFDGPPAARDANQVIQGGLGGAVGDVVGDLLRAGDAAAGDHPVAAVGSVPGPHFDACPVVDPQAVSPAAAGTTFAAVGLPCGSGLLRPPRPCEAASVPTSACGPAARPRTRLNRRCPDSCVERPGGLGRRGSLPADRAGLWQGIRATCPLCRPGSRRWSRIPPEKVALTPRRRERAARPRRPPSGRPRCCRPCWDNTVRSARCTPGLLLGRNGDILENWRLPA